MQVDFYHLTRLPLERALPQIADKVLASGARLLIVSGNSEQRVRLDRDLWTAVPESFLPHAQLGEGDDTLQPILIAPHVDPTNGARYIALVDGQWRNEALAFDRAFHFFDEDGIGGARTAWKALDGRTGVERCYWKQNDAGRWERAA